jgi:hypothetical protein
MAGFTGFDWVTMRTVAETLCITWNEEFFRKMKYLEEKIYQKTSEES